MTLTSADFAPLVSTLSDNLGVIVGVIVSVAALNAVIRIVKRHAHI